jgi:hypothetical protein
VNDDAIVSELDLITNDPFFAPGFTQETKNPRAGGASEMGALQSRGRPPVRTKSRR